MGYQLTQHECLCLCDINIARHIVVANQIAANCTDPVANNGELVIGENDGLSYSTSCRIKQIQLEQDTAKVIHSDSRSDVVQSIDYNRAGAPLIEIVTRPDIR